MHASSPRNIRLPGAYSAKCADGSNPASGKKQKATRRWPFENHTRRSDLQRGLLCRYAFGCYALCCYAFGRNTLGCYALCRNSLCRGTLRCHALGRYALRCYTLRRHALRRYSLCQGGAYGFRTDCFHFYLLVFLPGCFLHLSFLLIRQLNECSVHHFFILLDDLFLSTLVPIATVLPTLRRGETCCELLIRVEFFTPAG